MTTLSQLKASPETQSIPAIPVIVLSAKGQRHDLRQAQELGARDYLLKPFDSRELLEKIAQALPADSPADSTFND